MTSSTVLDREDNAGAAMRARNDRAVRIAAGLLAVLMLPASVLPWMQPWSGENVAMRFLLPAFACLFTIVAATGQASRASALGLRAVMAIAVAWVLALESLPLLHLPVLYTAAAFALAALTLAAYSRMQGQARGILTAAGVGATLALAWYRDRLGAYAGPLPPYVSAFLAGWVPPVAVLTALRFARGHLQKRRNAVGG